LWDRYFTTSIVFGTLAKFLSVYMSYSCLSMCVIGSDKLNKSSAIKVTCVFFTLFLNKNPNTSVKPHRAKTRKRVKTVSLEQCIQNLTFIEKCVWNFNCSNKIPWYAPFIQLIVQIKEESNNKRVKLWNLKQRKPTKKEEKQSGSGGSGEGSSRKPAIRSLRREEMLVATQRMEVKLSLKY